MTKILTVSPSPHVYSDDSVRKIMYHVIIAMLPILVWSIYLFGFNAVKLMATAVAASLLFEYLIQKYVLKGALTINDGSAVITGMLLAFNVPATLPLWIVVIGAFVAIVIGKMTFGGLGKNPFNPALVGRVFLVISFPAQMTSWPAPSVGVDAMSVATPLSLLKEAYGKTESLGDVIASLPTAFDLFMGNVPGSAGEMSALCILIGFFYLLFKRVITWHIPVVIVITVAILQALFFWFAPHRFAGVAFHILSGGIMLGAVFMATDMVTSPMSKSGQFVYAFGIGLFTVLIRNFGSYPEGISFAILVMNAFTPLINIVMKPRRFGGKDA